MSAVLVAGVGEGEPDGEVLDGAAARELTDRIRDSLGRALEAIAEFRDLTARAWRQRAWVGLGYASWEEYCEQEFSATAIRWSIEAAGWVPWCGVTRVVADLAGRVGPGK